MTEALIAVVLVLVGWVFVAYGLNEAATVVGLGCWIGALCLIARCGARLAKKIWRSVRGRQP